MPLTFITGNKNKLAEVQAILGEVEGLAIDLPEIQDLDAHKIIAAKLNAALEHHAGPFIVEDTSLYLDCLNGLPGPFIKWFLQTVGNKGLANIAEKLGNPNAQAKTIIGYAAHKDDIHFFEVVVEGRIVPPQGETSFGWDVIFIPNGHTKTYAEMGQEEKNQVSMRSLAAQKLNNFLIDL